MREIDVNELRSELGEYLKPSNADGPSAKAQRNLAGFEDIERFLFFFRKPDTYVMASATARLTKEANVEAAMVPAAKDSSPPIWLAMV
jgi:hypothetical protein